jgi:hypothetical protein
MPVLSMLLLSAAALTLALSEVGAGLPMPPGLPVPNVNVRIDGYLPAPPGVNIQVDAGRPYYVERERRVYIEREGPPGQRKAKKHRKNHGNGHDKHR